MSEIPDRRVAPPRYQVTERDLVLLRDLWLFRYLSSAQVSRLHFGHMKVAQRRLRKLFGLALVTRFRQGPASTFGDRRWIYGISRAGARAISSGLGDGDEPFMPPSRCPSGFAYLDHHEMLSDFRIWLREACGDRRRDFSCRFVPAFEEVRDKGRRRRRIALDSAEGHGAYIPDGVFSLDHKDGRSALFVLEIDRGTEPLRRESGTSITQKLEAFSVAFDEGLTRYGDLFDRTFRGGRLLWVVPDRPRLESILRLAEGNDLDQVVWAAERSHFESAGDLRASIWFVAGRTGPVGLVE